MVRNLIAVLALIFTLVSCSESTDGGGTGKSAISNPDVNTSNSTVADNQPAPDDQNAPTGDTTPATDENTGSNFRYYTIKTPTGLINSFPRFDDDMNFKDLDLAINRQLKAFKRFGLNGEIHLGGKKYPLSILKTSILRLFDLSEKAKECLAVSERKDCMDRFNDGIKENFVLYGPQSNSEEEPGSNVTYTAYYSPLYKGSSP